jgi:hypothetical protein
MRACSSDSYVAFIFIAAAVISIFLAIAGILFGRDYLKHVPRDNNSRIPIRVRDYVKSAIFLNVLIIFGSIFILYIGINNV